MRHLPDISFSDCVIEPSISTPAERKGSQTFGACNEKGAIIIAFTIMLVVLIGFLALGMEVGQWYLVRAQLSQAVDAAALAAARNISNPFVNPTTLAAQYGEENFPQGFLGTPDGGAGAVSFQSTVTGYQISVTGSVGIAPVLSSFFGTSLVTTSATGAAQRNNVEIMMVLDRSGSMSGAPESDLKSAATTFLNFFSATQAQDQLGLISFATSVTVECPLSTNSVTAMINAVNGMSANGATNTEDAITQAGGPSGLPDQTGLPGDQKVMQFLIFFSDGHPTAFRGNFVNQGTTYDAVVCGTGNTCSGVYTQLGNTGSETWMNINPVPTGDGLTKTKTKCSTRNCWPNTEWTVLNQYPISGYSATSCSIPTSTLAPYVCATAEQMALNAAQTLKNRGVIVYAIGLGSDVDMTFMTNISSGANYAYYAPSSSQLSAIFNSIAIEIQLQLVQ